MGCGCKKNKKEKQVTTITQLTKEERDRRTQVIREKLIRLSQKKQ
jgi:hypothetical protein|tara:strand:+ start:1347 stop:1481 length:135 start_codon:yes stop_codon:yes gene_type:complete